MNYSGHQHIAAAAFQKKSVLVFEWTWIFLACVLEKTKSSILGIIWLKIDMVLMSDYITSWVHHQNDDGG